MIVFLCDWSEYNRKAILGNVWYSFFMRLHRFYIETPITEKIFDITDRDLVHQWRSVFRYNVGSQVILFDGSGTDYFAMITSLRNLGATVSVFQKSANNTTHKRHVWLCMALIKKDNFEWVVQKATELGVTHIVPILSERTEKKKINMERLHKIAIEASEQSGRGDVPAIHEADTLAHVLESGMLPEHIAILHFGGVPLAQYVAHLGHNDDPLAIFVGPEGGWTDGEIEACKHRALSLVSLGSATLRAETAAIAAASMILLQ